MSFAAVTSVRIASFLGLQFGPVPSRPRPFHFANRTLVTSYIRLD